MYFSIIVPVYNVENYIEQCLDSILKQSFNDKEIILINDGSTDRSGEICDFYAKKYTSVHVVHKKNGGVAEARNKGLSVARGKYIIFLDGDDYWYSDVLLEIKKKIEINKEPDLLFVHNEYHEIDKVGLKEVIRNFNINDFNYLNGESTLEYLLTNTEENLFSVWRGIFKREVIHEKNIYFEKGVTVGEDADWLFRFVLNSKKTAFFKNPFYVYRINRVGSAMSTKSKKALESFLFIVTKWIENYKLKPTNIGRIISMKLSNNYVENFKYIYNHDKSFCDSLIIKIKKANLITNVNSNYGIKIINRIEKHGFEKALKTLNYNFRIKSKLKYFIKKL